MPPGAVWRVGWAPTLWFKVHYPPSPIFALYLEPEWLLGTLVDFLHRLLGITTNTNTIFSVQTASTSCCQNIVSGQISLYISFFSCSLSFFNTPPLSPTPSTCGIAIQIQSRKMSPVCLDSISIMRKLLIPHTRTDTPRQFFFQSSIVYVMLSQLDIKFKRPGWTKNSRIKKHLKKLTIPIQFQSASGMPQYNEKEEEEEKDGTYTSREAYKSKTLVPVYLNMMYMNLKKSLLTEVVKRRATKSSRST